MERHLGALAVGHIVAAVAVVVVDGADNLVEKLTRWVWPNMVAVGN